MALLPSATIVMFTTENDKVHLMYKNINVNDVEIFFVLINDNLRILPYTYCVQYSTVRKIVIF